MSIPVYDATLHADESPDMDTSSLTFEQSIHSGKRKRPQVCEAKLRTTTNVGGLYVGGSKCQTQERRERSERLECHYRLEFLRVENGIGGDF